jgi:hypothetical protein
MTIRAELADGRVLEFPDGTDPSVIQTTVKRMIAAQPGAAQSSGPAGFSLSDLAASFAQGAYGSTQALTDVFGAGNVASQKLEDLARSSQAGMSSARQAELQRQQERLRQAEATGSTWEEIKAAAKNIAEAPLQSAAQAVGSFAPYLPTMLFGPAAAAALGLGARSVQAANAVAKASPTVIGTAQGAGAVKGAIYDAVYRAEIEDGRSEEEARVKAAAAQEYTGQNIDQILTGAGVGLVAGRYGAERLLTPGAAARASQSMLGRIGTAAAVDVPTEAIQGGQERLAANLALQREGRDVPLFEGVAGQATQEGLLGLLGSAPIAAIRGPDREAIRREEEARVAVTEEELAQRFPDVLPGGFKINREETGRETVPQGFSIMAQGRDEPLSVVDTQEEATAKLESLTKIRAEERNKLLQDEAKINADVQKARDKLERLEATEQTNTEEYQSLKTQMPTMMDESAQKIKDLYDRSESLAKPLTVMPFGQIERVNEQFNVLGPDNKPVGTFKTLGEAEAVVQQTVGEDVFKQTQQRRETAKELYKTFVPQMRKFGLGDVGLNIVDRIENGAGGAYLDKLIRVSLEDATPVQTMRHESLHAMKDLGFFTPQQWKALEERANKQWIKELKETKYDDKRSRYDAYVDLFTKEGEQKGFTGKELDQYVSDAVVEESIADAFGAYDKGAKPPPGMIAALYRKIKNFFASLGQALRGAGFQSADDIFQSIERGRLKPAAEATPAVQEKLSLKTIDDVINDGVDRLVKSARTNRLRRDEDRWLPGNGRADTNLTKVQDGIEKRLKELGVSTERVNGEKQLDKIIYDKVLPAYRAKLKEFENVPYGQEKFSLARERIPLSTRSVIEDEDNAAREALGLNTEAKRGRFNNVRDIARALNNDTLKKHGAMDRKNLTDDDVVKIADAIADEVSYQLGTTAKTGTGLGWYSNNYPNAVKRLQARFPELADNQHARSVFSAIVAVTSNGEKVTKNISNAVELYSKLRDGKPMVAMGNRRATALENNLRSIERLLEDHNTDFEKHLLEEITVKDMNARLREMGEKSDGSYLADTVVPRAAIYFGPKLGAFYANLSGSEGYLTMDLWWTRSINRMRGLLIPKATTASINKFRDMMDQPSASRDEVVAASIPLRNKYKDFGFTTELEYLAGGKEPSTKAAKPEWFKQAETAAGDAYEQLLFDHNLEKMANTIYKNEYEMLEEAPFTASDRAFMYKAARNAQAKLRKSGVDLTLADIQAALWYYEKRLYAKLSGVKADDIGYEEAIIAQASEGDGRAGPSVVFGRKSDAGAVAGREVQRAEKARPEPAVEEKPSGKAAKLSLKAPTSPEFKRWLGDSKIVNKDGTPMVMYHGLAKDTTDFTRKTERGAPIFLTDDPEFATRFAADSYESVARNPEKYLSKEQIDGGVKRAISAIKKDYGKDSLGKEMIESLKTGDLKDATPEAREYIQKEFINLLPTGPHIMPMYVRAERPFDYENPGHIRKVLAELTEDAYDPADIRSGSWESIENADFQDAIQNAGFDSFYVKEHGRKNLAVYQPNQVKSATGNVGTYSLESPDVRYSLRGVAFPTAKEAQEAAEAVKVPDTPEFKQYIAGSQWVDEDGKAKKFFHATTSNFFEFNDGVIYLSDTAEESAKWGRMAEDRLRERVYKALNKDEKLPFFQQAVDEAVSKDRITKAQGEKFMRDATRNIPDFDSYNLIKKEMDDVLLSLSPERMKIMPLYARAMTPFDFRNKEHVQQVMDAYDYTETMDRQIGDVAKQINKQIGGAPTVNVENILDGLKGILAQGFPKVVERPDIMRTIRKLGFDGYVVRRNRTAPMSYAVFKPQQVKSITGNDGQFNLETKDVRYSLSKVRYTPERFDRLYNESMYTQSSAKKKTKGYLAFVDPMDFVKATASPETLDRLRKEQEPLDTERLKKESQPLYLSVVERNGEWKITSHEGRHRMLALHEAGYRRVPIYIDIEAEVAEPIAHKFINAQYDDSVSSFLLATVIEPLSYDNRERAREKFTRMESEIKFSLPTLSKAANDRIKQVAPGRVELGFKERVIGGFKNDYTSLRQMFINRYDSLAKFDQRMREKIRLAGGPELLADQSAEFAALQSDVSAGVAASAMGIGDRQGGVPVYRNGFTTIDTSVKGLTEALAPLAKYGDPEVYQRYQFWAGWKRGRRLLDEGKERLYNAKDAKLAQEIEAQHPEFVQVQKDLIAFNNGIVNFAVQTGVLSRERAQVYTQYADYIPFYRQLDLDKTIGPNPFGGISGVRGPKELKGGEAPLADFLETMVRNTQSMINSGMKNIAAQRATKVALEINETERLPGPATGIDVYTQLENGQVVYYRSSDQLFIDALKSLNMPDLPFMGLLSGPANVLRNLVTKDPGFMMANLLRDSLSSYVTSGQKITPIVGTMVNFGKALSAKDKNLQALFNAGVVGGYEFSQNIEQSGETLSSDLNKKAGKDAILLRPFKSLWEGLEKGTTASDAATRMAVYERVMKETGNEAEAISRAMEVMNFSRKGNNVLIRIATAAIPFFNARLQGLDLFYRASAGQMNTQDAKEIKRRFWIRGMTMAALSSMYYLSVADDEEYQKQEEETKDNNWIFTSVGIRVPIPFEVGTLFKTMPERIIAYFMGNDTGKDLGMSTLRALANTFAFNPIPQTFKPIVEVATNFNFFTMRPIVGQGMQEVEARFQVGPGTSKTAEYIGGLLNLSPLKVDQLIKGYTGTIGGYVTDVIDAVSSEFSDVPKASLRFEQLPVVKRFALDPEARGSVTQFYELQRSVDTVVRTMSLLEKTARPEEFSKYLEDNIGLLAVKDYVRDIEKSMKDLREMRRTINSSDMESDEKRDLLVDLGRMENNLTANIKSVKKAVSELK